MMCNGMLAGLVAITSPCAFVTPVGGGRHRPGAGVLVVMSVNFFDKIEGRRPGRRDQRPRRRTAPGASSPWACSPTAPTVWAGTASAPPSTSAARSGVTGLFYGDSKQLVAQLIEVVVCIGWNVAVGGILFAIIGKLVGNRVPAEVEIAGLDIPRWASRGTRSTSSRSTRPRCRCPACREGSVTKHDDGRASTTPSRPGTP